MIKQISPVESTDSRQPFKDSDHLVDLPDLLTAEQKDELVKLQKQYRALVEANNKFDPAKWHAQADSLRERMVQHPEESEALSAQLAASRAGFTELRLAAKERTRRHVCLTVVPWCIPILEKALEPIRERISLIDADFRQHFERCAGHQGCGHESPLTSGLRSLEADIERRLIELRDVSQKQKRVGDRVGQGPYYMTGPLKQLRGLVRWLPTEEDSE